MRLYGQDIIDMGGIGRRDALVYCKDMCGRDPVKGQADWGFINMSLIARKPPSQKAAHRDWRDNLPAGHPDAPRLEADTPKKTAFWDEISQERMAIFQTLLDAD